MGHADHSGDLRGFIQQRKKIVISTVQKFPFIVAEIGSEHRSRSFALIIDEAHSSQGGRTSAAMSSALSQKGKEEDDETIEDEINRIMEAKKLQPNVSYFAFTATPKNKTLEMFGAPYYEGAEKKFRPFHSYTMKQAIDEGFICDVLKNYTPVNSYYKLVKKVEDDPEFDSKRANKKLRHYVESHEPCYSAEVRNHGRSFPGAGDCAEQNRRPSTRDGGYRQHRTGDPIFPRDARLSEGAEEPLPSDRRLFG